MQYQHDDPSRLTVLLESLGDLSVRAAETAARSREEPLPRGELRSIANELRASLRLLEIELAAVRQDSR